jgi:V8-like Glu-specific endopeptidase
MHMCAKESLAIVKIFVQYEYSKDLWAMGTGWLISPELMVTAGNLVFNHGRRFGRATVIKAYIGYSGRRSIGDPGVQFRAGSRCVTTSEWLRRKGAKPFDVGFIRLNKPFVGIEPIEFMETPLSGKSVLGVVGYPGDLADGSEKGARMYEMFAEAREPFVQRFEALLTKSKGKYNLAEQDDRMLEYYIDTYGGE